MRLLVALTLACVLLGAGCGEESSPEPEMKVLDTYDSSDDDAGDRLVLEHMREAGADFSKPTDVRWYIYFPGESAARGFAEKAAAGGWKVELSRGEGERPWLCRCSRDARPSLETILGMRRDFAGWAEGLDADIDGWEAAITK